MKVLIADDEAPARERLARLVGELLPDAETVVAPDGLAAWAQAQRETPDLALLDIRMPGLNGLELAERLAGIETPPAVIFVTAFDEHALAAFKASADDYLLKPVERERLAAAIDRARCLNRTQREAISAPDDGARARIQVSLGGRIVLIELGDVLAFVAEQKYVVVHHRNGEALLDETLKSLEEEFGERFLRIHRNALVARRQISGLVRRADGRSEITLCGDARSFEVSRRHLPGVRTWLRDEGQRGP